MWKDVSIPFVETVVVSVPYWKIRTLSGALMLIAQVPFMMNMFKTLLGNDVAVSR